MANALEEMLAEINGGPTPTRDKNTRSASEWKDTWGIGHNKAHRAIRVFLKRGAMRCESVRGTDAMGRPCNNILYRDLTGKLSQPFAAIAATPSRKMRRA